MPFDPLIHSVFGHFHDLNLLVLLENLRRERVVQGAWLDNRHLCPVAHGMANGHNVLQLWMMEHDAKLDRACDYAARQLGAEPRDIARFVRLWDSHALSPRWLLRQLELLWDERLADAVAVQDLIAPLVGEYRVAANSGAHQSEKTVQA